MGTVEDMSMPLMKKWFQPAGFSSSENEISTEWEKEILGYNPSENQQVLKVSIFSPDRCVREFLQGILAFQGYQQIHATDLQGSCFDLTSHSDQVVILDGAYLMGIESEGIGGQVQRLVQEGVHLLVLADRQLKSDFTAIQRTKGCQVLWKPLDYRQVGQVMAQI